MITGNDGLHKVAVDTRADCCLEVLMRRLLPSSTCVLMAVQKYMRSVLLFINACKLSAVHTVQIICLKCHLLEASQKNQMSASFTHRLSRN